MRTKCTYWRDGFRIPGKRPEIHTSIESMRVHRRSIQPLRDPLGGGGYRWWIGWKGIVFRQLIAAAAAAATSAPVDDLMGGWPAPTSQQHPHEHILFVITIASGARALTSVNNRKFIESSGQRLEWCASHTPPHARLCRICASIMCYGVCWWSKKESGRGDSWWYGRKEMVHVWIIRCGNRDAAGAAGMQTRTLARYWLR